MTVKRWLLIGIAMVVAGLPLSLVAEGVAKGMIFFGIVLVLFIIFGESRQRDREVNE